MTADVLLTVSGMIPEGLDDEVASARRPRPDYRAIQSGLGYDVVDERAALERSTAARLLRPLLGRHVAFALAVFLERHDRAVVVTDAEHTGLPFAALLRLIDRGATRHVMICHRLSSRSKRALISWFRLDRAVDRWVVYSTSQRRILVDDLGIEPARVHRIDFATDLDFFRPSPGPGRAMILSVGSEHRDFATLAAAVDPLDIDTVVVANSPWADTNGVEVDRVPTRMRFARLSWCELREHYQQARVVVVPLEATDHPAGITSILETMACARPLVYTRTSGQTDTVDDGVTGVPVTPGDADDLRRAIAGIVADERGADALGSAARAAAEERFGLSRYVEVLGSIVDEVR